MRIRRRGRVLCFAASLLLLGPWLRPVAAQLLGPEFQVNSYTTGGETFPAVAADGSGNFVVAWEVASQDGSYSGIFGQRFNSAGSPAGIEFQVNTYTTDYQRTPAVAVYGAGNFVVVWHSELQDGSYSGVFGQRFDSSGSPVGGEFQVNSFVTGYQRTPAVAAQGTGNFVVVWHGEYQDGSSSGVFGQRFDSAGSPVGIEFQVNSYTTGYQRASAVAADAAGNFVVTWDSEGEDGSSVGIFGQRFNSAGSPLGSEFQVNSYTTGYQRSPAVAADSLGNFVVAWESFFQDGAYWGVFGQRFSSTGAPVGSEFQVNTFTTSDQSRPAVATESPGNFVVVWQGELQDGSNLGVLGQRFGAAGSRVGSEFRVNTYTTSSQLFPAVAADGSGNFVVAWDSDGQDGSFGGIFGQRLSNWILIDGFEAGNACAWSAAVGGGCP